MIHRSLRLAGVFLILALGLLAGCAQTGVAPAVPALASQPGGAATQSNVAPSATQIPNPTPAASPTSAPSPTAAPTNTPSPSPTPAPLRLSVAASAPEAARAAALAALPQQPAPVVVASGDADLRLETGPVAGDRLVYEHLLVPVSRFSTLLQDVAFADVRAVWGGSGASSAFRVIMPEDGVVAELTALLGPPGSAVRPQPAAQLPQALAADHNAIGIVPFDALNVRLHALRLDGQSITDNRFTAGRWALATRGWLTPVTPTGAAAMKRDLTPVSNRDPSRLTVLVMTGVTALTRGTAAAIEKAHDFAFPARVVGPELAAADLTTTSNEVSFAAGCQADNRAGVGLFCARPEYSATLTLSGIDLIGLTGNHLNDFGTLALSNTLQIYRGMGIRTYGGGQNDAEAHQTLIVTDHGNRLAFLGANPVGPGKTFDHAGETVSAWATANTPGAATYDAKQMAAAVTAAHQQADVVLAELQWLETNGNGDYQVQPVYGQEAGFRALSDAGATIVTGVQAHAPQSIELRDQGLILYGLGNLYFDQTWSWPTRTGLVVRHTIYDHRLLSTELLVTVIGDDMQVRWATPAERAQVLRSVFAASGWNE